MKTFIKTFACALAVSALLLACNDTAAITGDNSPAGDNSAKDSPKHGIKEICDDYGTCKPEIPPDMPPYNPDTVLISPAVKEWMDEQLASGKNDRRDIYVFDMQSPTRANPEPSYQCSSSGGCIVNGEAMSLEEYYKFRDEFERKNPLIYRKLDIPGEIIYGGRSLMTASEIKVLAQRYTEIAIEFYIEPQNDDMPLPMER